MPVITESGSSVPATQDVDAKAFELLAVDLVVCGEDDFLTAHQAGDLLFIWPFNVEGVCRFFIEGVNGQRGFAQGL